VRGFRVRHGGARGPMSITLYNKLKREGRGPVETVLGDGVVIITAADEAAWEVARSNPTDPAEIARVAEVRARWHDRAKKAGAKAAKSPNHVSNRRKRPPPRAKRLTRKG
jgi:hypothetical protein